MQTPNPVQPAAGEPQNVTPDGNPLPMLQAAGFSATVDAFAGESDQDPTTHQMRLWFISLLGPQQAVKALWARLVKGESATLSFNGRGAVRFCALAPEGPRRWHFYTASLPAAAGYQGVLVPESALYGTDQTDFLLLPLRTEAAAVLHYRFLNRRLDLPLHARWADWLWQRALRVGEAAPLEALGLEAYRCIPNPDALAADLGAAVRLAQLVLDDSREERQLPAADNSSVGLHAATHQTPEGG